MLSDFIRQQAASSGRRLTPDAVDLLRSMEPSGDDNTIGVKTGRCFPLFEEGMTVDGDCTFRVTAVSGAVSENTVQRGQDNGTRGASECLEITADTATAQRVECKPAGLQ